MGHQVTFLHSVLTMPPEQEVLTKSHHLMQAVRRAPKQLIIVEMMLF